MGSWPASGSLPWLASGLHCEPHMNSNSLRFAVLAVVTFASSAFAQFRFDAATGTCRNAAGEVGFNVGVRGACGDLRNADLSGASLESMDLRGAKLDGANLKGAALLGADLTGASLRGANLMKASLRGAKLQGARLDGALLLNANLERARLDGATFTDADLRNACLYRAHFEGADLRGARFSQSRALVDHATWSLAVADMNTLPFSADELASRNVQVAQVATR